MGLSHPISELASALKEYLPNQHLGWAVVGSVVHNDPEPADIDIWVFTDQDPQQPREHYRLVWHNLLGLLSISQKSPSSFRSALQNPADAVYLVPAARSAVIGHDPTGQIQQLLNQADAFQWADVQSKANEQARESLMGLAEELMKVRKGLRTNNKETALRAATGLFLTCPWLVILATGTLLDSENTLVTTAKKQMPSNWAEAHDLAAAWTEQPPSWQKRCLAAGDLYRQTVTKFADLLDPEATEVVTNAVAVFNDPD